MFKPLRGGKTLSSAEVERMAQAWSRQTAEAATLSADVLDASRAAAHQLRAELDRFAEAAALRTAALSQTAAQSGAVDWATRPALWHAPIAQPAHIARDPRTELGRGATLFHDCPLGQILVSQLPPKPGDDGFTIAVEAFSFRGSFLSLGLDLPPEACVALTSDFILRAALHVQAERATSIYLRLNLQAGPNTEQVLGSLPGDIGAGHVDFDLGYANLDDRPIDKMWLDIMVEHPAMNRVELRDLVINRRRRADL